MSNSIAAGVDDLPSFITFCPYSNIKFSILNQAYCMCLVPEIGLAKLCVCVSVRANRL